MTVAPISPSMAFSDKVSDGVLTCGVGLLLAVTAPATALVLTRELVLTGALVDAEVDVVVFIVTDLHPTNSAAATNMIGMNLRIVVQSFD